MTRELGGRLPVCQPINPISSINAEMVGLSHAILEVSAFPDVVIKGFLIHRLSRVEGTL